MPANNFVYNKPLTQTIHSKKILSRVIEKTRDVNTGFFHKPDFGC